MFNILKNIVHYIAFGIGSCVSLLLICNPALFSMSTALRVITIIICIGMALYTLPSVIEREEE